MASSGRSRKRPARFVLEEEKEFVLVVFTEDNVRRVVEGKNVRKNEDSWDCFDTINKKWFPAVILERSSNREQLQKKLLVLGDGTSTSKKNKQKIPQKPAEKDEKNMDEKKRDEKKKDDKKDEKKKEDDKKKEKDEKKKEKDEKKKEKDILKRRDEEILKAMQSFAAPTVEVPVEIPVETATEVSDEVPMEIDEDDEPPTKRAATPTSTCKKVNECTNCQVLEARVLDLEKKLAEVNSHHSTSIENEDRPRQGKMALKVAERHHMHELTPGSGVFVYSHTKQEAASKKKASGIANFLLSVFYTHEEILDSKGLPGLDGDIIAAIVEFAMTKRPEAATPSALRQALRVKMEGIKYRTKKAKN